MKPTNLQYTLSLLFLFFFLTLSAQEIRVIDNKGTIKNVRNNTVTTSNTQPSNPVEDDIWFDTSLSNTKLAKVWDGNQWLKIGSYSEEKTFTLSAEYDGGILESTSSNNKGCMSAEFITADNTNVYKWLSSQASAQEYAIRVKIQIPSDFDKFAANAIQLYYKVDAGGGANVDISVFDKNGAILGTAITGQSSTSLTTIDYNITSTSVAANDHIIVLINMSSDGNKAAYVGDIKLNYKAI